MMITIFGPKNIQQVMFGSIRLFLVRLLNDQLSESFFSFIFVCYPKRNFYRCDFERHLIGVSYRTFWFNATNQTIYLCPFF